MKKPKCETCPYWEKTDPGHVYADCRAVPPMHTLMVNISRDHYSARDDKISVNRFPNASWPNTGHDDWCGLHPDAVAYIASKRITP